jgi:DNA-binding transcriptional LysR family regulator
MEYPNPDWDDLRVFLALARAGSVRGAARDLRVTHPTVSRRLGGLEELLGARLFERMPDGYALTEAGQEVLGLAVQMEEQVQEMGRRVLGRDTRLSGRLRVTLSGVFANRLLMPDLKAFQDAHPRVELEVETSYSMADLSRREADVAVRCTNSPPEELVGRRLMNYASAAYASLEYLAEHDPVNAPADCRWIGWTDDPNPVWLKASAYPNIPVRGIISDPEVQLEACKAGMGIARLGCFAADREPNLRRLPPGEPDGLMQIWILTHPDLKNTLRVRSFMEFLARVMGKRRDLMEGRCGQPTWQPA